LACAFGLLWWSFRRLKETGRRLFAGSRPVNRCKHRGTVTGEAGENGVSDPWSAGGARGGARRPTAGREAAGAPRTAAREGRTYAPARPHRRRALGRGRAGQRPEDGADLRLEAAQGASRGNGAHAPAGLRPSPRTPRPRPRSFRAAHGRGTYEPRR